jgi:hypothetical protein
MKIADETRSAGLREKTFSGDRIAFTIHLEKAGADHHN